MTELQQYIWTILGLLTVLIIQWIVKKIFSNYDKNKAVALEVVEEDRARMETKLDQSILIQKATVHALCNMNTIPELKTFSKEFEKTYIRAKERLKENPEMGDIL